MKINKIILILFAVVSVLFMADIVFAGLGVSPSQMIVPNLSKGARLERTFILSRSDPKEDLHFTAIMEGATKDWTALDKGMNFTMSAGEKRFPITIIVNVPKDAANGEYKGGVRLVSSLDSDGIEGNGASTILAALIQTDFTVTGEQILEYDVSSISIKNFEEGSPLDISVMIINAGNVTARPTKIHLEIYDKFNRELLESQDIIEMKSVAPFTTGDIIISAPTKLEIGQYWARISAYKDEALLKAENLVFEIVAVGSLQKKGNLKEIICNKKADIGEIVKITGVFENNGQSDYYAKFVAEIFKSGKLIKLIESDLVNISKGKIENLSVYFTPDLSGEYTVKSHVFYAGEKTPEKEFKISVGNIGWLASISLSGVNPVTAGIIFLIFIVAIIISAIFLKKKRRKKYKK
jgi:hypothetical protein